MPFDARIISVMIAGPSDVNPEIQSVHDIIYNWNVMHAHDRRLVLLPLSWKSHAYPEMGNPPQAIIGKQVVSLSDLLIAVFWTRIGTPTEKARSGTVQEIEEHLAAGKQVMLYFSEMPAHPYSVDDEQFRAVREFREQCKPKGIVERYSSLQEFRDLFSRHLTLRIIRNFKNETDGRESQQETLPELSPEAKQLLLEAAADPSGTIMAVFAMEGFILKTNNKSFVEPGDPRLQLPNLIYDFCQISILHGC